jgi:hypothetical protein
MNPPPCLFSVYRLTAHVHRCRPLAPSGSRGPSRRRSAPPGLDPCRLRSVGWVRLVLAARAPQRAVDGPAPPSRWPHSSLSICHSLYGGEQASGAAGGNTPAAARRTQLRPALHQSAASLSLSPLSSRALRPLPMHFALLSPNSASQSSNVCHLVCGAAPAVLAAAAGPFVARPAGSEKVCSVRLRRTRGSLVCSRSGDGPHAQAPPPRRAPVEGARRNEELGPGVALPTPAHFPPPPNRANSRGYKTRALLLPPSS